jgi:hypothetical protein
VALTSHLQNYSSGWSDCEVSQRAIEGLPVESCVHAERTQIMRQMPNISQHSTANGASWPDCEVSQRAIEGTES